MTDEIKVAPMHKLIKRAGADRVSEESAIALGKALEEIGVKVAKEALDYAKHAGQEDGEGEGHRDRCTEGHGEVALIYESRGRLFD